jgi:hypothetical protein
LTEDKEALVKEYAGEKEEMHKVLEKNKKEIIELTFAKQSIGAFMSKVENSREELKLQVAQMEK